MFKQILFVVLGGVLLHFCNGHTYSLGDCPSIDPMPGFNMNKMLGVWYVIQKTSTASTCITYNFTKLEEPDEYNLEQVSQHFILGLTPLEHEYRYTGHLTVPDPSVPGRMKVKFPLNVLGKASFTVFMTDYDNFAALYTCQGLGIGHRESATILSRTKSLDKVFIDKARTRLSSHSINPFDLSIISQKNCPKHVNGSGYNINIDSDTFSAQSVAGVVRSAGEKIGDGIEYVATGAKKVYSQLSTEDGMKDIQDKVKGGAEYVSQGAQDVYTNIRHVGEDIYDRVQNNNKNANNPNKEVEWLP